MKLMEKIIVSGGNTLRGEIEVSGMKNSAVAILFATILVDGKCIIENLPPVNDVCTALKILEVMGASVKWLSKTSVEIDTKNVEQGK